MTIIAVIVPNNYNIVQRNFVSVGTPVIADPPKNQTIVASSDTLFTCAATGYPCPDIRWIQNNSFVENQLIGTAKYKKFIHVTEIEIFLSPMCAVKSTLVISNVTVDDVGNYTCSASNIVGNAITTAQLAIGNFICNVNIHTCTQHTHSPSIRIWP